MSALIVIVTLVSVVAVGIDRTRLGRLLRALTADWAYDAVGGLTLGAEARQLDSGLEESLRRLEEAMQVKLFDRNAQGNRVKKCVTNV